MSEKESYIIENETHDTKKETRILEHRNWLK